MNVKADRTGTPWTMAEVKRAQAMIREHGLSSGQVAVRIGRPSFAIEKQMANVGFNIREARVAWRRERDERIAKALRKNDRWTAPVAAAHFGLSSTTIARIARAHGIDLQTRRPRPSRARHMRWFVRWLEWETYASISRSEGVTPWAVKKAVERLARELEVTRVRHPQEDT